MVESYFSCVGDVCQQVMEALKSDELEPGRYGGRYVARCKWGAPELDGHTRVIETRQKSDDSVIVILNDDDPLKFRDVDAFSILAHVTADETLGIGRARYWINSDGSIDSSYFDD